MLDPFPPPSGLPRSRRLRFASGCAFAVWVVTLAAFMVAVTSNARSELLSALGGLASVMFTVGVILRSIAVRREWAELSRRVRRDDLRASRSRR